MRIAIVHSFYSRSNPSGENVIVQNLLRLLREAGHEVRLFSKETDDLSRADKLRLSHTVAAQRGGYEPWREIVKWKPDVTHVHNLFPSITTRELPLLRASGIRLVSTVHNYRSFCSAATLSRPGKMACQDCVEVSRWQAVKYGCYRGSRLATLPLAVSRNFKNDPLFNESDRVICLSEVMKAKLEEFGVDGRRLTVVPNFSFQPSGIESTLPADVPTRVDGTQFGLYAGRLTVEKGIQQLLDCWDHSTPLVVAGSGPLRAQVTKASTGSIQYFGALSAPSLQGLMNSALALIFPSTWSEGLPMVYIEALASGLPTICSNQTSLAKIVQTEGTGIVTTIEDMNSTLINQAAHLRELRHHCKAVYSAVYSPAAHLRGLMNVYNAPLG